MKSRCYDRRATDSIIKSGHKDTEASIKLNYYTGLFQVIPGNLQKYISTNRSLLQCKILQVHFSNNMMVHCLLNAI